MYQPRSLCSGDIYLQCINITIGYVFIVIRTPVAEFQYYCYISLKYGAQERSHPAWKSLPVSFLRKNVFSFFRLQELVELYFCGELCYNKQQSAIMNTNKTFSYENCTYKNCKLNLKSSELIESGYLTYWLSFSSMIQAQMWRHISLTSVLYEIIRKQISSHVVVGLTYMKLYLSLCSVKKCKFV